MARILYILAASRLAPAEGHWSLRDWHHLPHEHRKHLKTLISENTCCVNSPCCVTISPLYFKQHYSLKTKPSVSKNGLGRPQNNLGGCRDQAYHFQHQKLPLYAQSREPFHTGHGRPFRTNRQANKQIPLCFISIARYIIYFRPDVRRAVNVLNVYLCAGTVSKLGLV